MLDYKFKENRTNSNKVKMREQLTTTPGAERNVIFKTSVLQKTG